MAGARPWRPSGHALGDDLKARGLGTSTGVLLVGPPGTGKTQLGTVVATELAGAATVLIPGSYVTEYHLTELFDRAADLSPTLILMTTSTQSPVSAAIPGRTGYVSSST